MMVSVSCDSVFLKSNEALLCFCTLTHFDMNCVLNIVILQPHNTMCILAVVVFLRCYQCVHVEICTLLSTQPATNTPKLTSIVCQMFVQTETF